MPVTGAPDGSSDRVRPVCNIIVCSLVTRCMITEGHVREDMSRSGSSERRDECVGRALSSQNELSFRSPPISKTKRMQRVSKGMHNPNPLDLHLLLACL